MVQFTVNEKKNCQTFSFNFKFAYVIKIATGKKFPSLFSLTANENCYEMNFTPSLGDFSGYCYRQDVASDGQT